MSLAHKLTIHILILLGCILLVGVAALVGLLSLSANFTAGADQHRLLRSVYEVGHHAAAVRLVMRLDSPSSGEVDRQLDAAIEQAKASLNTVRTNATHFTPADRAALDRMLASLRASRSDLQIKGKSDEQHAGVNAVLSQITTFAGALQDRIIETQHAGRRRLVASIVTLVGFLTLTMAVAVTVGVRQHRSVMRPIRALERATLRISDGEFTHRLTPRGEIEFRRLADHFNAMAEELGRWRQSLREQVEAKSRQLVRSEQLAAVGRLAAGFAHEINNPLGIIAGYAESAQRRLERAQRDDEEDERDEALAQTVSQALGIITEEAFRCRRITDGLLCAARPETPSERVNVAELIDRLLAVLEGLPRFAGRELVFAAPDRDRCDADLNPGELTQVLCNLVTNALEAVPAAGGRVEVELRRWRDRIEIRVHDNGRGMSAQTLERVFEPFFTDKLDRGESGSGLGLAVCHTLVQRMGGRIDARSAGPGAGSVFTVEIPLSQHERAAHA